MIRFCVQDKEAGNRIEDFGMIEDANKAILRYEEEDKMEGNFTENFYEIGIYDDDEYIGNIDTVMSDYSLLANVLLKRYTNMTDKEIKKHIRDGVTVYGSYQDYEEAMKAGLEDDEDTIRSGWDKLDKMFFNGKEYRVDFVL